MSIVDSINRKRSFVFATVLFLSSYSCQNNPSLQRDQSSEDALTPKSTASKDIERRENFSSDSTSTLQSDNNSLDEKELSSSVASKPKSKYSWKLVDSNGGYDTYIDENSYREVEDYIELVFRQEYPDTDPDPIDTVIVKVLLDCKAKKERPIRLDSFSNGQLVPERSGDAELVIWRDIVPRSSGDSIFKEVCLYR